MENNCPPLPTECPKCGKDFTGPGQNRRNITVHTTNCKIIKNKYSGKRTLKSYFSAAAKKCHTDLVDTTNFHLTSVPSNISETDAWQNDTSMSSDDAANICSVEESDISKKIQKTSMSG